jgi:hypothetical protein
LVWQQFATATGWTTATGSGWIWLIAWILLATATWTVLGGLAGFILGWMGQTGAWFLAGIGSTLFWILRLCGLRRAATYFA